MKEYNEENKKKKTKKTNFSTQKNGHRKHVPYGAQKQAGYDGDDDLNSIVNKKKERRKNKNIRPEDYMDCDDDY